MCVEICVNLYVDMFDDQCRLKESVTQEEWDYVQQIRHGHRLVTPIPMPSREPKRVSEAKPELDPVIQRTG